MPSTETPSSRPTLRVWSIAAAAVLMIASMLAMGAVDASAVDRASKAEAVEARVLSVKCLKWQGSCVDVEPCPTERQMRGGACCPVGTIVAPTDGCIEAPCPVESQMRGGGCCPDGMIVAPTDQCIEAPECVDPPYGCYTPCAGGPTICVDPAPCSIYWDEDRCGPRPVLINACSSVRAKICAVLR